MLSRHRNEHGASFDPIAPIFGVGSLATSIFIITPQLLLLFYLSDVVGAPPALAGLVLLLPKLWEFLTDPLVGLASDRTRTSWGARLPYLAAGTVLLPLAFAAMFTAPEAAHWGWTLAWVAAAYLVATTAYSLFAIPYIALPGELSPDPARQTRLVAWRMGFVAVGILLAGGGAPALVSRLGGSAEAYRIMGGALAIVMAAGMAVACLSARAAVTPVPAANAPGWLATLRAARCFRRLSTAYLLQMVAAGLNGAALLFFARYVLERDAGLVAIFILILTAFSLAATPFCPWLSRRWGLMPTFRFTSLLYAAGYLLIGLAHTGHEGAFWLAAAVSGLGNAGTQVFAFALLPQAIAVDTSSGTGAGLLTGVWVALEKFGLALGGAIAGVGLSLAGHEAGVAASPLLRTTLYVLAAVLPAGLMAASVLISIPGLSGKPRPGVSETLP